MVSRVAPPGPVGLRFNGPIDRLPPGAVTSAAAPVVPMMPVPRCDGCRFWKPSLVSGRGPCAMSMRKDGGLSVFMPSMQQGQVWTRADFGCVQFEART
jgi:hypothetical protein